jgi:hypothetical protein
LVLQEPTHNLVDIAKEAIGNLSDIVESVVTADPEGFSYVDLNEVDPTFKPLPTNFYQLKVLKAEVKSWAKNEKSGEYVKFQLAVVNHPEYSGRRLFESLFFSKKALRSLRLLMDATGISQVPGSPIEEWLRSLTELQPEFKTKVECLPDLDYKGNVKSIDPKTGQPMLINVVKWSETVGV